ncbi:hypothetical protein DDE83_007057 [Stemphylium lycopersici]|uniref:Uncharacterized protein n=1 Tax=Stemphylium lycopersici TaxID=183478 RepID=A0A364MXF4_STELY|nr:hypothetical protein DDE83_007057 [Stemphylium lycopersici]
MARAGARQLWPVEHLLVLFCQALLAHPVRHPHPYAPRLYLSLKSNATSPTHTSINTDAMNFIRSKRASSHYPIEDDRPAKRISTPAGQRLSIILENNKRSKSPASNAKINVTTESTFCNDPSHQHVGPVQHGHKSEKKAGGILSALTGGILSTPRESSEEHMHNGSNLSVSVWSDREDEKFGHIRQRRRRRGIFAWGWKKIALVAAIIIILIVALAVGLAVGLKKDSSSSSENSGDSRSGGSESNTSNDNNNSNNNNNNNSNNENNDSNSPTATGGSSSQTSAVASSVPSNFPVGTYSLVVFLDTVTPECTADTDTWTCAPNTNYYDDPQKALTILNWEISGSSGSYRISSGGHDDTFDTTFQNENLELLDQGEDTERYRFQISRSKTVNVTGTLGGDEGDFECDYGATNMQGYLYTKMQRTYPDQTIAVGDVPNPEWPFAVRIEQAVAGGQASPSLESVLRPTASTVLPSLLSSQASLVLTMSSFLSNIWPWTPPAPSTQKRKRGRMSNVRSTEKRRRTLYSPSEYQNAAYGGSTLTLIHSDEDMEIPGTRYTPEAMRTAADPRSRANQLEEGAKKLQGKNVHLAAEPCCMSATPDPEERSGTPPHIRWASEPYEHINLNNSNSKGPPPPSQLELWAEYTPKNWHTLSAAQKWTAKPNLRAREVGSAIGIRHELQEPEHSFRDTEIRDGIWKVQDRMQMFAITFFPDGGRNDVDGDAQLPASFYEQLSPETVQIIDCVASAGPAGVRGWHEMFTNPQKRRTLVCVIIGNVLVEQVFRHRFFGGDEGQIGVLAEIEREMKDEEGFTRTIAYAARIHGFLTHTTTDGNGTDTSTYMLPPNFNAHINTVTAALITHLDPLLTLSHPNPTPAPSALFTPLHTLTVRAALLSLHMHLDPHTVYHFAPAFKEQAYTRPTMDVSNARQMAQQNPLASPDTLTPGERSRRAALGAEEQRRARRHVPLTQISIMNGLVAYRPGGWEAPARCSQRGKAERAELLYEDQTTVDTGLRTKVLVPAWVFCRWGRAYGDTCSLSDAEAKKVHGDKWDGGFVGLTSVPGVFDWRGKKRDGTGKGKAVDGDMDVVPAEVVAPAEEEDWGTLHLDFNLPGAAALEMGERGLFEGVGKAKTKGKAKGRRGKKKAGARADSDPDR